MEGEEREGQRAEGALSLERNVKCRSACSIAAGHDWNPEWRVTQKIGKSVGMQEVLWNCMKCALVLQTVLATLRGEQSRISTIVSNNAALATAWITNACMHACRAHAVASGGGRRSAIAGQ